MSQLSSKGSQAMKVSDYNRRLPRAFAGSTASAVMLCFCGSPAFAQTTADAAVVEVAQARQARVAPKRWVPGSVVSRNDARLATSAAGRLVFVAEVGTQVRAGERVAKLEDDALKLQAEAAKAETARIEAQRSASARQLQRLEQLENNSISQTQLDEVRSQLAMLTAQLQQAQVRHRAALHDLDQTEVRAPSAASSPNGSCNAASM